MPLQDCMLRNLPYEQRQSAPSPSWTGAVLDELAMGSGELYVAR
jgi:hypothetical protein